MCLPPGRQVNGKIRFNRYMVECESSTAMLSEFVNFVLIDTWWNVNQLAEGGVLKKGQGFNRYMVECECITIYLSITGYFSFNRYMVECESVF